MSDDTAARCDWCEGYFASVRPEGDAMLCEMCREPTKPPLSKVGEMNADIMECGDPETSLHEAIRHFRWRASCEASVARELRQTAAAAKADADEHSEQAVGFLQVANAMERMPVTFPALAAAAREGGDGTAPAESPQSGGEAVTPNTPSHRNNRVMIKLDEEVKARIVANVGTSSWTREAVVKAAIDAVLSHLNKGTGDDPYETAARACWHEQTKRPGHAVDAIADYLRERDERLIEAMQAHWGASVVGYLKAEMAKS